MQAPIASARDAALLGAVVAFGLILSTTIAARAFERNHGNDIAVKGYAERKITSDQGVWRGRFAVHGGDLVTTYDELKKQRDVVTSWLAKQGVKPDAIELSSVSTSTVHKQLANGIQTNEIEGYTLTQSVDVEGSDIALIARIANRSTELLEKGVEFESDAPLWFYTRLDDLKIEMLGEAAKDARVRAERIAAASKGAVGALRSADQGVFQITSPTSTEVSGFGELDTSSIKKSVKAIVTVRYAVE